MISVVIPLYNKEKSITDTVNSVLNQTYRSFELIIVNDGSIDSSLDVVNAIDDERIKVVDKKNGGVSSARNAGILEAKYNYIAFLDGDDIWHKCHLQILYDLLLTFDSDMIGGAGSSFYKSHLKKNNDFEISDCNSGGFIVDDYFAFMGSTKPRFNSSSLLVKKDKVLKVGLFDESLAYGEDVEFWYRLFSDNGLIYTPMQTTLYYQAAENRSADYIMPLHKRFHLFNFKGKSISEKRYLDKLLAIIMIDYLNQGSYRRSFKVWYMYRTRTFGVLAYMVLLFKKKFF